MRPPGGVIPALPAFWVGLIYDETSLDAAADLVSPWSAEQRQQLRDEVPKLGFSASVHGRSVLEIAKECLELSRHGLRRRRRFDQNGVERPATSHRSSVR